MTFGIKPRNRPRGKPFAKGNKHGNRFKKGVSGNPSGRPHSKILSEAYKKTLEMVDTEKWPNPRTNAEAIAQALVKKARAGNESVARELADRTEGKPRQAYEVKLSIFDELSERIEKARRRTK